jgi:uncharacterized protein YegP (UPF0339 family)
MAETTETLVREGTARVEFFEDSSHEWRFRCKGGNNEITLQSEGYKSVDDATATAGQFLHPSLPWFREVGENVWEQIL